MPSRFVLRPTWALLAGLYPRSLNFFTVIYSEHWATLAAYGAIIGIIPQTNRPSRIIGVASPSDEILALPL